MSFCVFVSHSKDREKFSVYPASTMRSPFEMLTVFGLSFRTSFSDRITHKCACAHKHTCINILIYMYASAEGYTNTNTHTHRSLFKRICCCFPIPLRHKYRHINAFSSSLCLTPTNTQNQILIILCCHFKLIHYIVRDAYFWTAQFHSGGK